MAPNHCVLGICAWDGAEGRFKVDLGGKSRCIPDCGGGVSRDEKLMEIEC